VQNVISHFKTTVQQTLTTDQILLTTEFSDFYKTAIDFCDFIENYPTTTNVDFMQSTRQHLLKLYDAALRLQWVDLQSNLDFEDKLHDKDIKSLLNSISDRLDGSRYYWHVFDPTNDKDTEAVCGDLVDDLGDIYKDLKNSITIFNLDTTGCKEHALWDFKFGFDKHWDDHCINALSALHFYLQDE
jgi:hypothetical protein